MPQKRLTYLTILGENHWNKLRTVCFGRGTVCFDIRTSFKDIVLKPILHQCSISTLPEMAHCNGTLA